MEDNSNSRNDVTTEKKKISFKGSRSAITPILDTVDKEIQYENMNFKERRQAKKEEKLAIKGREVKAKPKKAKAEPALDKKEKSKSVISPVASFAADSLHVNDEPSEEIKVEPVRPIVNEPEIKKVEIKPIDLEEEYFDDDNESSLFEDEEEEEIVVRKVIEDVSAEAPTPVQPVVSEKEEAEGDSKDSETDFGTSAFDNGPTVSKVVEVKPIVEEPQEQPIIANTTFSSTISVDSLEEEEFFDDDTENSLFEDDYETSAEDYAEEIIKPIVEEKPVVEEAAFERVEAEELKPAPKPLEPERKKEPQRENKYIEAMRFSEDKVKKEKPVDKMRRIQTNSLLVRFAIQAALVVIFFTIVIRNTIVMSGSMEPTLVAGDYAVYNKLAYKFVDVQRGDIITFWSDEQNEFLSKRVIGIPGDSIEFHDGYVFINGLIADESAYLDEDIETNCVKTFKVPDGCVFVMGDNRENSYDSRFFLQPYIPIEKIEGKYIGSVPKLKLK